MPLKLITAPVGEPLDLTTVKQHLRVDFTDDDILIAGEITAARQWCEQFQQRAYMTQTWELWLDAFPDGRPPSSLYALYSHPPVSYKDFLDHIQIPLPPLQTVAYVKYYITDGTLLTMDPLTYFVDTVSEPGRVCLNYMIPWPMTVLRPENGVVIRFTAGYGTPTAAAYTTALGVVNADLKFTSKLSGATGNQVSISYVNPGVNNTISVTVTGAAIVVTLGYAGGVITSTGTQVKLAIEASAAANALVSVTYPVGSTGAGVVTALSPVNLSGGIDTIPANIKQAILLIIGDLYKNRETSAEKASQAVLMSAENLLWQNRVFSR